MYSIPLVIGDSILDTLVRKNNHLTAFYNDLGGNIMLITILMLGLTYMAYPRPSDRETDWVRRGKRAYLWNTLTSFLVCSKVSMMVIFVGLTTWLGY